MRSKLKLAGERRRAKEEGVKWREGRVRINEFKGGCQYLEGGTTGRGSRGTPFVIGIGSAGNFISVLYRCQHHESGRGRVRCANVARTYAYLLLSTEQTK